MKKTDLNSKPSGRARRQARPLRGETLVNAARAELGRMVNLSPKTDPINILRLAKRLQVTRQALYTNELEAVLRKNAFGHSKRRTKTCAGNWMAGSSAG